MDIISDMLTRIRNGLSAKKTEVTVFYSKQNIGILRVLKDEGYIGDYSVEEVRKNIKQITVKLRYYADMSPIKEIKRVSKSSCRIYNSINDLPLVYNGLGVSILSTSKGILSDYEAREKNVGGEIICSVF